MTPEIRQALEVHRRVKANGLTGGEAEEYFNAEATLAKAYSDEHLADNDDVITNDDAVRELKIIFDLIDKELGDTDPFLREEMSDEDIKYENPLFWCAMKLNAVIDRFAECDEEHETITEQWFRAEIGGGDLWVRKDLVQIGVEAGTVYALAYDKSQSITYAGRDPYRFATFTTKTAVRQFCDAVGIERKEST